MDQARAANQNWKHLDLLDVPNFSDFSSEFLVFLHFCLVRCYHVMGTGDGNVNKLRYFLVLVQHYDIGSVMAGLAVCSDGSVPIYSIPIGLYYAFWSVFVIRCCLAVSYCVLEDLLMQYLPNCIVPAFIFRSHQSRASVQYMLDRFASSRTLPTSVNGCLRLSGSFFYNYLSVSPDPVLQT